MSRDEMLDPAERVRRALGCGAITGTWEWDITRDRFAADEHCARSLSLDFAGHGGWLPGVDVRAALHPDDWHALDTLRAPPAENTGNHSVDFRARQADGSYRWLRTIGCCDVDRPGSPEHFAGIVIDIDAHKSTEARLRHSENEAREISALLQAVIEAVPALIYVKARNGRMLVANAAVMALVGKPWEQIRNRTDAEFLDDQEEAARIMATDRRLMDTGGEDEVEEIVGSDSTGPRIWLSHKKAFRDQHGLVMGLVGTSVDITARKRGEQGTAASEARLRRVIDNIFTFVGITDLDGTLLEANRAPVEGAGLSFEDVLGRPFWDTHWWSHDDTMRGRVKAAVEAARDGQTSRFDVDMRWRDDKLITIDFQIAPLRDEAGDVVQLIPSGVDVTARKQAEAHRQALIMELHHRVQNLFMVASAMISMTARRVKTPEDLADAVTGRLTALARAHSLIRPAITGESAGRAATLEDLISDLIEPHLMPEGHRLRLDGPATELLPNAATALALVFHELATNSAKYGALSGPEGQIEIEWMRRDADLVLTWTERGGPPIGGLPTRQGFGSQLIRSTVTTQLGGSIDYDWAPIGLRVRLSVPVERLSNARADGDGSGMTPPPH
jgi:PAS domain S-box-containing protein